MATLRAVTNTGAVPIRAGDVCIQDASVPTGVQQSSAYGQAGVAGVAMEAMAVGGLGHVVTGGVAFVNCVATPGSPISSGASVMAGPGGLAVAGTTNPFATTRHAAFSSPAAVTLTFTAAIDADVQATITAALAAQSVALTVPAEFSVSGSPVVGGSGTLAVSKATQAANRVYAGPASGSAAAPTFRALGQADLPAALLALPPPPFVTVAPATSSQYFVRAVNALGAWSDLAFGRALSTGAAPAFGNPITVAWGVVAGADHYEVYEANTLSLVGTTASLSLVDTGQRQVPAPPPAWTPTSGAWTVAGLFTAGSLAAGYLPVAAILQPTISSTNGGGTLTGTFHYAFTLIDALGRESAPSGDLAATVTAGTVTVAFGGASGLTLRLYRGTSVGVYTQYREVTSSPVTDDDVTAGWVNGSPPALPAGATMLQTDPLSGGLVLSGPLGLGAVPASFGPHLTVAGLTTLQVTTIDQLTVQANTTCNGDVDVAGDLLFGEPAAIATYAAVQAVPTGGTPLYVQWDPVPPSVDPDGVFLDSFANSIVVLSRLGWYSVDVLIPFDSPAGGTYRLLTLVLNHTTILDSDRRAAMAYAQPRVSTLVYVGTLPAYLEVSVQADAGVAMNILGTAASATPRLAITYLHR